MKYFDSLPKIEYPFFGKLVKDGRRQSKVTVPDLLIRYKFKNSILNNKLSYYNYIWKDGMRVDILAHEYYGSYEHDWIVLLSANIYNWVYDVPMNSDCFNQYLMKKYNVSNTNSLKSVIHHYEDGSGYVIDFTTYQTLANDSGKRIVYVFDYEFETNENRRQIKLISKEYLPLILDEFSEKLNDLKKLKMLASSLA